MNHTFFQKIQIFFIELLAKIHWRQNHELSPEHRALLHEKLAKDYYIIATRRDNQLTTFFISLGHWFLTGNWGYYSHVLMNLEDEVQSADDFRLIEATGVGVHYSTFDQVFNPTYAIALIKPKGMTVDEWTKCMDDAKTYLGRPYDNLFALTNALEINCVELVRLALQALPDYEVRFSKFEALLRRKKKLTPQMFAECDDFEVVLKLKR